MSDTPRVDAELEDGRLTVDADFARQLERELAFSNSNRTAVRTALLAELAAARADTAQAVQMYTDAAAERDKYIAEAQALKNMAINLRRAAEHVASKLRLTPGGDALEWHGSTNDRDALMDAIDPVLTLELAAIDAAREAK